jgi:hypothetical protein
MKRRKVSLVVGLGAVLVASLVALKPQLTLAQGDPFLGNWVLNVAKSKYTPGPPPKNQTVVYEVSGKGLKVTAKGTDNTGKPTLTAYTVNYDGKDYAVTGNADYDMTALKRIDTNTVEFPRKKNGKVVQTGTNVVSKDGKTRTVTAKGVNAQGQKINNVTVYEKK